MQELAGQGRGGDGRRQRDRRRARARVGVPGDGRGGGRHRVPGAEQVADDVRAAGRRALAVQVDVSSADSVEALAERCYRELGGCHLLCNNAGVFVVGAIQSRTAKDWEWVLGVNLWGVVHGLLAFLPRMLAQPGEKHIVNTASTAGLIPTPGVGVYATAKYAVVGLSEHLRMDLAKHAIGVSVLCPGGVLTQILRSERNRPAELGGAAASPRGPRADVGGRGASPGRDAAAGSDRGGRARRDPRQRPLHPHPPALPEPGRGALRRADARLRPRRR